MQSLFLSWIHHTKREQDLYAMAKRAGRVVTRAIDGCGMVSSSLYLHHVSLWDAHAARKRIRERLENKLRTEHERT